MWSATKRLPPTSITTSYVPAGSLSTSKSPLSDVTSLTYCLPVLTLIAVTLAPARRVLSSVW